MYQLLLFATDAALNANVTANTGDAVGLAREQFWGVMICVFVFVSAALVVILAFFHSHGKNITKLFEKSMDASAKLADAIQELGEETRSSNASLRDYLDRNLDKVAAAIQEVGLKVEDHAKRIDHLEQTVTHEGE